MKTAWSVKPGQRAIYVPGLDNTHPTPMQQQLNLAWANRFDPLHQEEEQSSNDDNNIGRRLCTQGRSNSLTHPPLRTQVVSVPSYRQTMIRIPTVKNNDTSPLVGNPRNGPTTQPSCGLKRQQSAESESSTDTEGESLLLADVVARLDRKYPQLNFPQYLPILEGKGIVYAESVDGFDTEYYVGLGMAEGAVGLFIAGVKKALNPEKQKKKRAKYMEKENKMKREESVEI